MSVEDQVEKEFSEQVDNISKVNLMVVGGTGVGKSSLVNKVFGEDLAETGSGEPVTRGCHLYEKDNIPVAIFDTEGYEIIDGEIDNSNFSKEVLSEIDRRKILDLKDQIHVFWYCISASNHRVTSYDIENIKSLQSRGLKVGIVITQCDNEEMDDEGRGVTSLEFRNVLKDNSIHEPVFETSTQMSDGLQLDSLIEWSSEILPDDGLREAFIGAQKSNIGLKIEKAKAAILAASGVAASAGGINPVPLSDSAVIVPVQTALAVRLAKIYGFNATSNAALALLKSQLVSLAGRQLAASLTKLVPVVGQLINASVAGAITAGFGFALNEIYKNAYIQVLETGEAPDWAKLFDNIDISGFIKECYEEKRNA